MTFREKVLRSSLLSAALFVFAAATPASAQYYDWDAPLPPVTSGRIPPQHIEAMVRSMGFQPVADPRPRGPLWVTHAVDRNGQHVRVLIDGFTGRMIDVLRRPMPPQNVAYAPPPNFSQSDGQVPSLYPPMARVPESDYQEGPDYDYRDLPRNLRPQQPQLSPPPNVQQQGPNVIPFDPRSDNSRLPSVPKTNTAKKKETKRKNSATAALTPEKEKQNPPSPKSRPADAPKAEELKKDQTKIDAPKTAQTPKMPASDNQRAPDPQTTGAVPPPVQSLETNKSHTPSAPPPVQPPF